MTDPNTVIAAWEAIEQIPLARVVPASKEELLTVIEEPLKPAIGAFFDRNIETIVSSCNFSDYWQGRAWISLCFDSLSDQNKGIVAEHDPHDFFEMPGGVTAVGVFFPIAERDTPDVIGQRALELANRFSLQNTLWSKGWNIAEARNLAGGHGGFAPSHEEVSDEELIRKVVSQGRYYDLETGLFYLNEIHHKKATQLPSN